MCLLPLGEPSVPWAEAARMRSLVLPIYEEMDRDADSVALGSVMGMAYRDLFHLEFRTGHYYLVLPEAAGGRRLPCLVFLHGLGGNVKACLWVLSKLSRQTNCAVIAPTFGFGNWDKPGGAEFVVDVVQEALATLPLDPKGLSDGLLERRDGRHAGGDQGAGLFNGLIYLSPVTEDELFSTKEFLRRPATARSSSCTAAATSGFRGASSRERVASLKRLGCNVRLKVYDDEDHWLLFSQQEAVLGEIREFMTADHGT